MVRFRTDEFLVFGLEDLISVEWPRLLVNWVSVSSPDQALFGGSESDQRKAPDRKCQWKHVEATMHEGFAFFTTSVKAPARYDRKMNGSCSNLIELHLEKFAQRQELGKHEQQYAPHYPSDHP